MDLKYYTEKIAKELSLQKEKPVKGALASKGVDPELYSAGIVGRKMRFNPLLIERNPYGEYIYYNDGSVNGLFIIGFESYQVEFSMNFDSRQPVLTSSLKVIHNEPVFLIIPGHHWDVELSGNSSKSVCSICGLEKRQTGGKTCYHQNGQPIDSEGPCNPKNIKLA
jgi:hypothetical protein